MASEHGQSGKWLDTILVDGLPRALAGSAGAAISRLIGAGVEIPATWLETKSQKIRDKAADRRALQAALTDRVVDEAILDEALIERSKQALLGKEYRRQQNREAVAKIAIQDLAEGIESGEPQEPEEDWMNKFERYSEDASSDDLQLLFGKLLSGQIRKPRSVSSSTLHFISVIEQETAELIQRFLRFSTDDGTVFIGGLEPELDYVDDTDLQLSGFWSQGSLITFPPGEGPFWLPLEGTQGLTFTKKEKELVLKTRQLSRAGKDLVRVVRTSIDTQAIADQLFKNGALEVNLADSSLAEGKGNILMVQSFKPSCV